VQDRVWGATGNRQKVELERGIGTRLIGAQNGLKGPKSREKELLHILG